MLINTPTKCKQLLLCIVVVSVLTNIVIFLFAYIYDIQVFSLLSLQHYYDLRLKSSTGSNGKWSPYYIYKDSSSSSTHNKDSESFDIFEHASKTFENLHYTNISLAESYKVNYPDYEFPDLIPYYQKINNNLKQSLLSPLLIPSTSDPLLKSINDTTVLPEESIDHSPSYNPWRDLNETQLEPDSKTPLLRGTATSNSMNANTGKVKAALISLTRNSELEGILHSMVQIEENFNKKYHYPWIFFNDKEFTTEFKTAVQRATNSTCQFVHIDKDDWDPPPWIDQSLVKKLNNKMATADDVQYAGLSSYHQMCRWNSGPFFMNEHLRDYEYYWRVEPSVEFFCKVDYDVFQYMKDNDKDYGFVINIYDSPQSVKSLWPAAVQFFDHHKEYLNPNSARQWVVQNSRPEINEITGGYSTCHFWSNFEIGRLDFFRSKQYQQYFNYLDTLGGFFYERWGDAPVHSLALALMADKSKIHWFKDIGYHHMPYFNCPSSQKCKRCVPGKFVPWKSLEKENCINQWFKYVGDG